MTFAGEDFSVFNADPTDPRVAPAARSTVLLVDDDADVLRALKFVVQERFTVRTATSGAQALKAMDALICAVILDVKMANMDGFETCEAIRRHHQHVPIIFHSAYQDRRNLYDVLNQLHPFAFLTKGEDPAIVLKTLHDAVEADRFRREASMVRNELADLKERLGRVAKTKG